MQRRREAVDDEDKYEALFEHFIGPVDETDPMGAHGGAQKNDSY